MFYLFLFVASCAKSVISNGKKKLWVTKWVWLKYKRTRGLYANLKPPDAQIMKCFCI